MCAIIFIQLTFIIIYFSICHFIFSVFFLFYFQCCPSPGLYIERIFVIVAVLFYIKCSLWIAHYFPPFSISWVPDGDSQWDGVWEWRFCHGVCTAEDRHWERSHCQCAAVWSQYSEWVLYCFLDNCTMHHWLLATPESIYTLHVCMHVILILLCHCTHDYLTLPSILYAS